MDFGSYLRRVGSNVRKARWALGLTQEQVAARGVTYRYYQEIERGERNPSLETLFTLARILDVTVAALVDVSPTTTAQARARMANAKLEAPKRGRKPSRLPRT